MQVTSGRTGERRRFAIGTAIACLALLFNMWSGFHFLKLAWKITPPFQRSLWTPGIHEVFGLFQKLVQQVCQL
jgi:hypothetical protein